MKRGWPIFPNPAPFVFRVGYGRSNALDRPQLERRLVDVEFPVEAAIAHEGRKRLIALADPPFSQLRRRQGPGDVVDPDSHKIGDRTAANVEGILRDRLEDHTH